MRLGDIVLPLLFSNMDKLEYRLSVAAFVVVSDLFWVPFKRFYLFLDIKLHWKKKQEMQKNPSQNSKQARNKVIE